MDKIFSKFKHTVRSASLVNQQALIDQLPKAGYEIPFILGSKKIKDPCIFEGNIENYLGTVQIPVGLAGPLKVNGQYAKGHFWIPMATTEGCLIASYTRGAMAISHAGGAQTVCASDHIYRVPGFVFQHVQESQSFIEWCKEHRMLISSIANTSSRHLEMLELNCHLEANYVFLEMKFSTDDAAGQNMVTFAADQACAIIVKKCPIKPLRWFIESNFSGDKKATYFAQINGRGKKVIAEATLPQAVVRRILRTTPQELLAYHQMASVASSRSGSIGSQGHFANALAAIYMACGQDVACVAESASGISRCEITSQGDLYASVVLPNLTVGTVGGGTDLPTQQECLKLLECTGPFSARKFAEICAATVLAGEISIAAAITAGHFAQAHKKYGRKKLKIDSTIMDATNEHLTRKLI